MGFTNRVIFVRIIQYLGSQRADIYGIAHIAGLLGLAAAVDTSARAAHDLNKMVIGFTGFHLIQKGSGIAQSRGYSNLYIHTSHRVRGFLDALHAAYIRKV